MPTCVIADAYCLCVGVLCLSCASVHYVMYDIVTYI